MPTDFSLDGLTPPRTYAPRDAAELAQILAQCNAENHTVIPWGGGTLRHIGNIPARYDAALSTTHLNHIVEYAADDLTGTFGAGMTIAELDRILGEHGQFLPMDVPHPDRATIGGVLAAGINGPLRLRYGPARDYMLGNRFATVDGQIIKAGSKVVKNVAGYELHKVQVGAFGTLGVITEATFKLFPKPPAEMSVWASFDDLDSACAAVQPLWGLATPPLAVELLDSATAHLIRSNAQGIWHLALRFGGSKSTMLAARDLATQVANENNARATDATSDLTVLWRAIADLPATLRETYPDAVLLRVSVPPAQLQPALQLLTAASPTVRLFAHAAVTSIYASFDTDPTAFSSLLASLRAQLHTLHGHLVVENAPLSLKKNLDVWDDVGATLKLMQSLKQKFDPNHILNPGRFVARI